MFIQARETFEEVGKWATVPQASQEELIQKVNGNARCLTGSKRVLRCLTFN